MEQLAKANRSFDVDFMVISTKLTSQDIGVLYIATSAEAAANIVVQLKQSPAGSPAVADLQCSMWCPARAFQD